MKNCMSIGNQVFGYKCIYIIVIAMNNLSALNRMLKFKFELRIDWYTNKGQMSSTAPNVMMCHFDP